MKNKYISLAILIFLVLTLNGIAANEPSEKLEYPWNEKVNSFHDKELNEKYPDGGFFLNLGPTGIRALIPSKNPTLLVVKYVFQDNQSPAKGLVEIGDVIAGANGKEFTIPHIFGRKGRAKGWNGPMMELSVHIEDAQATDGKLNLIIWPSGQAAKKKVVTIQLKVLGRFSKTYPFNCERSNKMREELCDFLVYEHKRTGKFGAPHCNAHSILSLMASGGKYDSFVKKLMSPYSRKRYNPHAGGFVCWTWGFDSIVMGEYYLLSRDNRLLPVMESLAETMPYGSQNANGIYTHRSWPTIYRDGAKPYASIAAISGLQMLGMSLFKSAGLDYSENLYQTIHHHYLDSSTENSAAIAYAFGNNDRNNPGLEHRHAILKLEDASKAKGAKGPGYTLAGGMKNIGKYTVQWPTKSDPRWKPLDWLVQDKDTNLVMELKQAGLVRVDRNSKNYRHKPEPTGPYFTTGEGMHIAPTGIGAAAHSIGNKGNKSWNYFAKHCANTCANSYEHSFSGHGGGHLHGFWNIVGAMQADEDKQREFLDYMKSFLIMSQTHNGGMVVQPWNRDRVGGNGDPRYGPRILPTATAAILLAMPLKRIQITGAEALNPNSHNPMIAIAANGLKVIHCTKEAEDLSKGKSYASVLKALEKRVNKGGEESPEAKLFIEKLQEWISEKCEDSIEMSHVTPAKSLEQIKVIIKMTEGVEGVESFNKLLERENEIKKMKYLSIVQSFYRKQKSIENRIARYGTSKSTNSLKRSLMTSIEKCMKKEGLNPQLLEESKAIYGKMGGE